MKIFLRKLPVSLMGSLVGPDIDDLVTKFGLLAILKVHPTLPSMISVSDYLPYVKYLEDPWFRAKIPCLTISIMSKKSEVLDIIPVSVLEKLISSQRFLSCIPADTFKKLVTRR